MDMPVVIVMLGVLLIVLVAVPLVGMVLLAGREDRGHHSRRFVQKAEAADDAGLAQLESRPPS